MVLHHHLGRQTGLCGIGQSELGLHIGILHGHLAGCCQEDVVPDTDVTSAHGGYPVPADGGMERGVVRTEDTTVEVRALFVLFLDGTDVRVLDDFYSQHVRTFLHAVRHVELAADEGSFQATYLLSV